MISFNSLKQICMRSCLTEKFETENAPTNKIIVPILVLFHLRQLLQTSVSFSAEIGETASQYTTMYRNIVENMEDRYIAYRDMQRKIKEYNLSSFIQVTERQVSEISELYKNKTLIEKYSLSDFKPAIYMIGNARDSEISRLSKIHHKIINPIVRFCINNYGISEEVVRVEDVGTTVGSEIELSIQGIRANQVYADIERDYMNIKKYIYNIEMTNKGNIKLIIK